MKQIVKLTCSLKCMGCGITIFPYQSVNVNKPYVKFHAMDV